MISFSHVLKTEKDEIMHNMKNAASYSEGRTTANLFSQSRSSASYDIRGEESCGTYRGRTVTSGTFGRAGENSGNKTPEDPTSGRNISSRGCSQLIDGNLGKYFGVLSRFVDGKSEQSDYAQLYRLKLVSLIELLQKISDNREEVPNNIFDVIRDLGVRFVLPASLPEDLVTEEFCFTAIEANAEIFKYIPDKFKSQRILKSLLKQKNHMIDSVPVNAFTEDLLQFSAKNQLEEAKKIMLNHKRNEANKINDKASVSLFLSPEEPLPFMPLIGFIPARSKTQKILDLLKNHDKKSIAFVDSAIAYKAPETLTEEECFTACANAGEELQHVPDELKTERVCLKALETFENAYFYFPTEIITEEIGLRILKIGDVDIKKIHTLLKIESFCLACIKHDYHLFKSIPYEMLTQEMCDLYFDKAYSLEHIPPSFLKDEHVKTIIKYQLESSYFYIPDQYRNAKIDSETLRHLCQQPSYLSLFKDRPVVSARLIQVMFDNALNDISYLNVGRIKIVLGLLSFKPLITILDKKKIIDLVEKVILQSDRIGASFETFLHWIKSPVLTHEFKHKCLNYFHNNVEQPCDPQPICGSVPMNNRKRSFNASYSDDVVPTKVSRLWITHENLINESNPLNGESLRNPSIPELSELCEHVRLFRMPEQETGETFIDSIGQALKASSFEPLEEHHYEKIDGPSAFCDGRTLRVPTDDGVFHYKLQRENEDRIELAKESEIHRYLTKVKARGLGLKSEIPVSQTLFKLSLKKLHRPIVDQLEPLEIHTDDNTNDNNERWVFGYCYRTDSLHYGTYAWKPDVNDLSPASPDDRFSRPEQGLLMACHDLGRWCAMGILHTSILPAFHDTGSARRWMSLHRPLDKYTPQDIFCGTLRAWNGTATERTDLRYSGLADLVDYERFGEVTSYFSFIDGNLFHRMPMVLQRLALANYIVETLLAPILIYARLHEDDPDYHIDSKTGKENLKYFIEKSAVAFLEGLTHHQNTQTLDQVLHTSEVHYNRWLERTAEEILYWTGGIKSTQDGTVLNKIVTNFANDLLKQGKLISSLYTDHEFDHNRTEYPDCYHNDEGQLNLGCNNKSFPLLSLIQGLTKLSTNIIYLLGD